MASGSGEQPLNSPTAADGRAGADRQLLKDPLNKEDDTQMVAVMGSSNHRLAEPMNPLLLASACFGSCPALTFLFSREDKQEPPIMMPTKAFLDMLKGDTITSLATQKAPDVEEGVDQTAMPAAPLLEGVTVEGDTALHAVATHGDGDKYLSSADVIYGRAKHLLFELNKNGDTPLHCAARAGNSQMVSRLIALARAEDNSGERLKELLRKENGLKETALHEAVRIGNNPIVKLLMTDDSELARFPKQGTSPLYLAISLEKYHITHSLHDKAEGNLSYSGPNGQNALHTAVLRKEEHRSNDTQGSQTCRR